MEIKSVQKFVRMSPRKLRLVANLVKGLSPQEAIDVLPFSKKRAAGPISKVIKTAIANSLIDPEYIPKAVAWIKETIVDHKILVHCNAGIGRSPSVVVCYLHEIGFGFEEAVKLVKSKRPYAVPHGDLRSAIMIARRMASFNKT